MFWIYIPPIILLLALIGLVVFFGKKTAELKKRGELFKADSVAVEKSMKSPRSEVYWKKMRSGLKYTGRFISLQTEKLLSLLLSLIKHEKTSAQQGVKKFDFEDLRDNTDLIDDLSIDGIKNDTGHTDLVSRDYMKEKKDGGIFSSLMARKPKIGSVFKPKAAPEVIVEDKKREDALIHRIAENPKDVEAYRELGDYYFAIGNIKDAKESFKVVLKLRPRDLKAKSSLREIEMKIRLKDEKIV